MLMPHSHRDGSPLWMAFRRMTGGDVPALPPRVRHAAAETTTSGKKEEK